MTLNSGTVFDSGVLWAANQLFQGKVARIALLNSAINRADSTASLLNRELLPVNGYTRVGGAIASVSWDSANRRADTPNTTGSFTASGLIAYSAAIVILNGAIKSSQEITAIDISTDTFTSADHGLVDGDRVTITIDSPGVLPGGIDSTQLYFVISATTNTFKVSETQAGAAVDVTSLGSLGTHPLRVRYGNGVFFSGYNYPSQRTVTAGQPVNLEVDLVALNAGYGVGI